jgi:hypothetical protein
VLAQLSPRFLARFPNGERIVAREWAASELD